MLSGVGTSRAASLGDAVERLQRGGLGGVLVAVVGALDLRTAERLARLRTGSSVGVAVVLDTETWAPSRSGAQDAAGGHASATALLAASGWRVLAASHGTGLASLWVQAAGPTARARLGGYSPDPAPRPEPAAS